MRLKNEASHPSPCSQVCVVQQFIALVDPSSTQVTSQTSAINCWTTHEIIIPEMEALELSLLAYSPEGFWTNIIKHKGRSGCISRISSGTYPGGTSRTGISITFCSVQPSLINACKYPARVWRVLGSVYLVPSCVKTVRQPKSSASGWKSVIRRCPPGCTTR